MHHCLPDRGDSSRIVASAALQITMVGIEGWGAGVGVVLLGLLLQDGLRRLARRLALRAQASGATRARLSAFAMTSGSTSCKAGRRRDTLSSPGALCRHAPSCGRTHLRR